MDLTYPPEAEAFRQEVIAWLQANLPSGWGTPQFKLPGDPKQRRAWHVDWHRKMHAAGYVGLTWPKEYGGQGADPVMSMMLNEELTRFEAPQGANALGTRIVGPTIIQFGNEEQKRAHLSKILSGEEMWCLGMSEPGAGSDLASLQTRAVEEGDFFVVNGQKVWTSSAHLANYIYLLVRTDPTAEKHRGISVLLVDMKTPGIVVRPLKQITGESEFNEVFLQDVRVPRSNLLGEKNQGWRVIMGQLGYERSGGSRGMNCQRALEDLVRLARNTYRNGKPASEDPIIRRKLAQLAIEVNIVRLTDYKEMTIQLQGGRPGPETSFGKLFWSELNQRLSSVGVQILGLEGTLSKQSSDVVKNGEYLYAFLRAYGNTIEMGTSEIQRNIIGERVLGLPRG